MGSGSAAPILLYVEDEAITQDLVATSLREAGFDLLVASNGDEALARLAEMPFILRGLVTDINLGDCPDGWDVARHARAAMDHLPVVYMSGACWNDWSAMGVPDSLMIAKPFLPAQVVAAISSLVYPADAASSQSWSGARLTPPVTSPHTRFTATRP
jgi:CheY-like chemotaxis protein